MITLGLAPKFHLGPLTLAWHGIMIAVGILLGSLFAARYITEKSLSTEPLRPWR